MSLHRNDQVKIYIRGRHPEIRYAEVRTVFNNVVTLSDGVTTFQVSRCDIVGDGRGLWLMN